jgi:hypothetical protein
LDITGGEDRRRYVALAILSPARRRMALPSTGIPAGVGLFHQPLWTLLT